MLKRIIATVLLLPLILVALAIAPAMAETRGTTYANGTVRVEHADHKVRRMALVHLEPTARGHAIVEFNNGSRWDFVPCGYEDSPRCYWDAQARGNGIGDSFIRVHGRTFYLNDRSL